jgi:hypothetical protein
MLHPYVDNLDKLSINELEDKVIELQRKYFLTNNPSVQSQISVIIDIYREQIQTRHRIDAQRQRDNQQDGDNSLDNLIKVS